MASNRRSMRNFLLDRKYQLRYTAIMVAISALLTTGLGLIWYRQVREASKIIEVRALASLAEEEVASLGKEIERQDNQRLLVLGGFGVLLVLVVTGYGIVLTHKVAGPMYKISLYMAQLRDGNLGPIGGIRKGDHLHGFFRSFQEMHDGLQERARQDVATLDGAIGQLEADQGAQALEALRRLRREKVDALGGEV